MNEYQSVPGNSSAPPTGGLQSKGSDNSIQMASEGTCYNIVFLCFELTYAKISPSAI